MSVTTRGRLAAGAAVAGLWLAVGTGAAQAQGEPAVTLASGEVRGFAEDGVENFFGIPYAAPPVGELRWAPPAAAEPWAGTVDATRYGAGCPQGFGLDSERTTDENCLFVNVQRPEGMADGEALPVVVVIHGGGWVTGSGNNENLNAMVRDNGIVGVTMNYRLGNLGFLPHPALADAEGNVGNYGLMDQVAALRWVRENIAAFGGDPAQVTIGGESAGAGSTCQILASPAAEGLYSRAFMMSTLCFGIPREEAEAEGEEIAAALGCDTDVAACLRGLPVDELIDAETIFRRPVKGTAFLPQSGWEKLQAGELTDVPVLIGATRNEGRSFLTDWETRSVPTFDRAAYEAYVRENFGEDADDVLAVYPWPEDPTRYTGTYLVAEIMMKNFTGPGGLSACKTSEITEMLAPNGNVWAYEFAPAGGPGWFEVPGYVWGAGHAVELPYLIPDRGNFANNGSALSGEHRQLSETMLAYWASFVRSGNPNAEGQTEWAAYAAGDGPVMRLREGDRTAPISVAALRASHNCDFWESLGARD